MNTENGKIDYRIMLDTSGMEAERIARNTDPLPGIGTDIKKLVQNTDRL